MPPFTAGVTPKDEGTRKTIRWKTETRAWTYPLVGSIRSWHSESIPHRGQRPYSICRQEFNADNHFIFLELTQKLNQAKLTAFFLMLLRDRGIPEATFIVVDVLEDVAVLACKISRR
jgi:hypothetical protein